ncbi:MAG TPA: DinB family protein [Trueperaceae bacterium]
MSHRASTPSSGALTFLLSDEEGGHVPFGRAIDGLSAEDAVKRPAGAPYSVAEVVAHVVFWQERMLRFIDGERPGSVEHAADGWPPVTADEWPSLVTRVLACLERMRAIAADDEELRRPLVQGRERTVGESIASHWLHDTHHLGQIILLRRMVGAWPPPGGGDTW